jgi:hypothetical protein
MDKNGTRRSLRRGPGVNSRIANGDFAGSSMQIARIWSALKIESAAVVPLGSSELEVALANKITASVKGTKLA